MAIEQKLYADPAAVLAAIAKLEQKVQSLDNAQKQFSARSKAAAAASKNELSGMGGVVDQVAGKFGSMVGPLTLVYAAVNRISAEWQNIIDRQQKAGQSAITFEQALGEATLNVGAVYGPDKLKSRALQMSAKTGVDPATAVQAMSLAIKSGGATNEAEAENLIKAAVVAGRLSPRAGAEKLADTSGSIASYMARTGSSAEQAGGVLLSMQSKSNIADPNKAMAAMGPTLANMLAQGASEGLAQALAPALSQAIEDTQGDVSSLAATQFTSSLTEQFGQREGFKGKKNIPDLAIAAMRADPALAKEFFESGLQSPETGKSYGKPELGRGKAETFFRAISGDKTLAGDQGIIGSYVKQLDEFQKSALTGDQAGGFYKDRLSQVQGATKNLQVDRILKGAIERGRIGGGDAMAGVTRDNLDQLLQTYGMSDTSRKFVKAEFDVGVASGQDPGRATIDAIRNVAAQEGGRSNAGYGSINPFELVSVLKDELLGVSEERKRNADNLERTADAMEKVLADPKNKNRNGGVENTQNN